MKNKDLAGCLLGMLHIILIYPLGGYFFYLLLKHVEAPQVVWMVFWFYWIGNFLVALGTASVQVVVGQKD